MLYIRREIVVVQTETQPYTQQEKSRFQKTVSAIVVE